jgi:predicted nuclease with RNAse H fold
VLTLGIDLASQDRDTASCFIRWRNGRAEVEVPTVRRSNAALLEEAERAQWVGIDAPFGWPDAFIEAVVGYSKTGRWPTSDLDWAPRVKRLRYRATDLFVEARARLPLSVSTDLIAVTAMRCATLLGALEDGRRPLSRTGQDRVVEVYPAAALVVWGFDVTGYKADGAEGKETRRALMSAIAARAKAWLELSEPAIEECVRKDHALDAFISSLACRAAERELTWPADEGHLPELPAGVQLSPGQLEREGWIHLPRDAESFDRLAHRPRARIRA